MRQNADYNNGGSSYNVKGKVEGREVLADTISHQDQRAFLQEDNSKRVEESSERQFLEQKRVQIHLREEVRNSPRVRVPPGFTLFRNS